MAALEQGRALVAKYALQLDEAGRPIAGSRRYSTSPQARETLAGIFGSCVGCGNVSLVAAMCRACLLKAEAEACRHGQHGYCFQCEAVLT